MSEVIASLVVSADVLADALKKFKTIIPKPIGHGSAAMRDNILPCFTQNNKLCLYAENYGTGLKMVVDNQRGAADRRDAYQEHLGRAVPGGGPPPATRFAGTGLAKIRNIGGKVILFNLVDGTVKGMAIATIGGVVK